MTGTLCDLNLPLAVLDRLMPMHLVVNATGHILHAGPTLAKVLGHDAGSGRRLLEVLELRRPRTVSRISELAELVGRPLHFDLRARSGTRLTGSCAHLADQDLLLLNLSFGISVIDAVGAFELSNADFAPTDLAMEMLYLVEAKSAAMNESRNLNSRLQGAKVAAEEQAFTDTLTGLKNRRAMDHILKRAEIAEKPFSLMNIDLDYFKLVNDTLGHAAGDHVLQVAAKIMVDAVRSADTVARVGGDEFVLLFQGLVKEDRLMSIAQTIIEGLEKPVPFEGRKCRISGSVGIAIWTGDTPFDLDALQADADAALYASKNKGRACATIFTEDLRNRPDLTEAPKGRPDATILF